MADDPNKDKIGKVEIDANEVIRDYTESVDPSAVLQGELDERQEEIPWYEQAQQDTQTPAGAVLSGGDLDAAWDQAASGEETVGGSSPTPDQDIVDEIGEALGVRYEDGEPLHTTEKIEQRDAERWELHPASSEDFSERSRLPEEKPLPKKGRTASKDSAPSAKRGKQKAA